MGIADGVLFLAIGKKTRDNFWWAFFMVYLSAPDKHVCADREKRETVDGGEKPS
jgi:hypothetical protein